MPCGHSCVIDKPKGMATNGPCHCLEPLEGTPAVYHEVRRALMERRRLRAAIEMVEWVWSDEVGIEFARVEDRLVCPWCGFRKSAGHSETCPRQEALGLNRVDGEGAV